ncbi:MAG: class I SAM-dependent rRNA methyltransferase [Chitinophagales bacterium]
MSKFPSIILHKHKAEAVKRFHPWIFSGAIKKADKGLQAGDVVEVFTEDGTYLATGHYGTGSIAVRVFSFKQTNDLKALWRERFRSAYKVREAIGLTDSGNTNTYRLIFAEGDGMPGLIADYYNGTIVLQCHTAGMYKERMNFVEALKEIYGSRLKAVYDKSKAALHDAVDAKDGYLLGEGTNEAVSEYGHLFKVDFVQGQKTGFFVDQRENRKLLSHYTAGKKILNTFCYSGGFSIYALKAGAELVHSVDSSAKAMEWTDENVRLNFGEEKRHTSFTADVFDFFKDSKENYDVIVLDPPAFAKGMGAKHAAIKAYTRLNAAAFKKIKSGGIVFTFSCSQVISPDLFKGAVTAAAIESGRNIRILQHLTQPADHPVSIYHPEGLYLKGLVVYVE